MPSDEEPWDLHDPIARAGDPAYDAARADARAAAGQRRRRYWSLTGPDAYRSFDEHDRVWPYYAPAWDLPLDCPSCGLRTIPARERDLNDDRIITVHCEGCGIVLAVGRQPTVDEARVAAATGHTQAIRDLPSLEAQSERRAAINATLLTGADSLPALVGEHLVVEWDITDETEPGGPWQVLRHDGVEIWRERAFYEAAARFEAVVRLLVEAYGSRLRELRPTRRSLVWLYGDDYTSPTRVAALNRDLEETNTTEHGNSGLPSRHPPEVD